MSAALITLKAARAIAGFNLGVARQSHAYLVQSCNRKIEESAAAVNRLTADLDEYDVAIEMLEAPVVEAVFDE